MKGDAEVVYSIFFKSPTDTLINPQLPPSALTSPVTLWPSMKIHNWRSMLHLLGRRIKVISVLSQFLLLMIVPLVSVHSSISCLAWLVNWVQWCMGLKWGSHHHLNTRVLFYPSRSRGLHQNHRNTHIHWYYHKYPCEHYYCGWPWLWASGTF